MRMNLLFILFALVIPFSLLLGDVDRIDSMPYILSDQLQVDDPDWALNSIYAEEPTSGLCPGDSLDVCVTGYNLPEGEEVSLYAGGYASFDHGIEGIFLENVNVNYNCEICPSILGLMVNPCGNDTQNEFAVIHSGCGFEVDDVAFDLNNNLADGNSDIGVGQGCGLMMPTSDLLNVLETGLNCPGAAIIPVGPGDSVPGSVPVLLFTDSGSTSVAYDLNDLCQLGSDIYVLQNECDRSIGAFTNDPCPGSRVYDLSVSDCSDQIVLQCGIDLGEATFVRQDGVAELVPCGEVSLGPIDIPEIPDTFHFEDVIVQACLDTVYVKAVYSSYDTDLELVSPALMITSASNCLSASIMGSATDCTAQPTGSAVVYNVAGGSGMYSYDWNWLDQSGNESYGTDPNPTIDGETITMLDIGTYQVIVYDVNIPSCSDTLTYDVEQLVFEPDYVIDSIEVMCFGGTGTVGITGYHGELPGGTVTADWDWNGSMVNDDYPPLGDNLDDGLVLHSVPAGTYSLNLVSAMGSLQCTYLDTFYMLEPDSIEISATVIDAPCYGGLLGEIDVEVMNGTPPFTFDWSGGLPPTEDQANVGAGNYTVTVTDSNGCTNELSMIVDEAPQLDVTVTYTPIQCYGDTSSLFAVVSGGTPPYFFDWDTDGTGDFDDPPNLTAVMAGDYLVVVSDSCGGLDSTVITLVDGGFEHITIDENYCRGDSVELYGVWYSAPGSYSDTIVSTTGGCDSTVTIHITEQPLVSRSLDTSYCTGDAVEVNGTSYGSPGVYVDTISSSGAGCDTLLTVKIAEKHYETGQLTLTHCSGDSVFHFGQWLKGPVSFIDTIRGVIGCDTLVTTDVTVEDLIPKSMNVGLCSGDSIEINSHWYVTPGVYHDTIISVTGSCDTLLEITLVETAIDLNCTQIAYESMPGANNGAIQIDIVGGNPNYAIEWEGPVSGMVNNSLDGSIEIFGLTEGIYSIIVTDAYGCSKSCEVEILTIACDGVLGSMAPEILNVTSISADCVDSGGQLTIEVVGGTPPIEYSIDGVFQVANEFNDLASGEYLVTVLDSNGCGDTIITFVDAPVPDTLVIDTVICDSSSISIGGYTFDTSGDYKILASGGGDACDTVIALTLKTEVCCEVVEVDLYEFICPGDTFDFEGIMVSVPGIYSRVIEGGAANECDTVVNLNLQNYKSSGDTLIHRICEGETVEIEGLRISSDTLISINDTSGFNCDSSTLVIVVEQMSVSAYAGMDDTLSCNESIVIGGVNPTGSVMWEGPGIDASNESLANPKVDQPGTYYLTVSYMGCRGYDSVDIVLDEGVPVAHLNPGSPITCDKREVELSVDTRSENVEVVWEGPGISHVERVAHKVSVSEAGTYYVTIRDTASGCNPTLDSVQIIDLSYQVLAHIEPPDDIGCASSTVSLDGSASTQGPDIIYIWLDSIGQVVGESSEILVSLAGMYELIVLDTATGCSGQATITVADRTETPPAFAGDDQVITCIDTIATLNEDAKELIPNITYMWTGPGFLTDIHSISVKTNKPGLYILNVLDTVNSCHNTDSVNVLSLTDPPVAEAGAGDSLYCQEDMVILSGDGSDIGPQMSYSWGGEEMSQHQEGFDVLVESAGVYYLTVTDKATGCSAVDSVKILSTDNLQVKPVVIEPDCFGDSSGSIDLSGHIGGTGPFLYSVADVYQDSPFFGDMTAGTYAVSVVDYNGCVWDSVIAIDEGPRLAIDLGADISIAMGDSVQLAANISPETDATDSLVWAPPTYLSCRKCDAPYASPLTDITYIATAYAGEKCHATDEISLHVDDDLKIYIPNVFSPNEDGTNDLLVVSAGTEVSKVAKFEVFDRWGEKVFSRQDFLPNDPAYGWDGRNRNEHVLPGVYVFWLDVILMNGLTISLSGDITLIR